MMARSVNQVLWDQWREHLTRQRHSGLSIAAFCRRENISSHKFHVWKRKLRLATAEETNQQRDQKPRPPIKARRRSRSTRPVRAAEFLQLPVAARPAPWIELALADGTILRLPQQNLAALVTALRVLRGERLELPCGECRHA
jgi:hypothetical protein